MIIFKYEITGSEVYTVCTETLYFNMKQWCLTQ